MAIEHQILSNILDSVNELVRQIKVMNLRLETVLASGESEREYRQVVESYYPRIIEAYQEAVQYTKSAQPAKPEE